MSVGQLQISPVPKIRKLDIQNYRRCSSVERWSAVPTSHRCRAGALLHRSLYWRSWLQSTKERLPTGPFPRRSPAAPLACMCGRLPQRKGEVTFGAAVGCGHVSGLFTRFMTAGPDAIRSLAPNQFCALRRAAR